jgi:CRISPR/Cas system-associated protein Cas5 (RAMP superfamily)
MNIYMYILIYIYIYTYLYIQHSRESRYEEVRNILEKNIKLRDKAEERFQAFFEREVYQLHNSVKIEKEVFMHMYT